MGNQSDKDTDQDVEEFWKQSTGNRNRGARGRSGRGRRGYRGRRGGRGRREEEIAAEEGEASELRGRKRGNRDIRQKLQEAEDAYQKDTNPKVRQIIDHLEEEALEDLSEPSMEDWENYIPDPGHTRGRMTLYKQSIHVYSGVKRLLAKAMEQVATEMAEMIQGSSTLRKDLENIQQNQIILDKKMDRIIQWLQQSGLMMKQEKDEENATKIL